MKLKNSVIQQIYALRKQGYTCLQISKMTGAGKSTIARYTYGMRAVEPAKVEPIKVEPTKKPAKRVAKKKYVKKVETNALSKEAVDYIHKIYESRNTASGTFIGNLFIRIGKMFGGHNPV